MLTQRDMKSNHSDLARRMAEDDKVRLVRDRFMVLKSCIMAGADSAKVPYLYNLAPAAATHH
jgi:hypothetical protein